MENNSSKRWQCILNSEMVFDLHLSGNALIVFALLHSYSQNGLGMFTGSAAELAEMAGCTRQTVMTILFDLTEAKLIERVEYTDKHNTARVAYRVSVNLAGASVETPAAPRKADKAPVAFVPPTVEQVAAYCAERKNTIDPVYFVDRCTAAGWTLKNGQKIKDWKAVIRTWESFRRNSAPKAAPAARKASEIYGG